MKKQIKSAVASPTLEAGFEPTLVKILQYLRDSDAEMLRNLNSQWKNHGTTMIKTLKDFFEGFKNRQ